MVVDARGREINEADVWDIVRGGIIDAVRESGGEKPLDQARVLHFANEKAAEMFKRERKNYLLISSLSIKSFPVKKMLLDGCVIRPLASRKKFPIPNLVKLQRGAQFVERQSASKYQLVSVSVSARTMHEAYSRATRALDLLRGVWTVFVDYSPHPFSLLSTKSQRPGIIHSGPLQTLHKLDGTLAFGDIYWYDPLYFEDYEPLELQDGWAKVDRNRRNVFRRLKKSPMKSDVEDVFVRYAIALDQTDFDVSFLHLWGILEKVTDSVGKYDDTIKRAAWPFRGRDIIREYLGCARQRRNSYVHSFRSSQETEPLLHLLKAVLDPMLMRLVRDDFNSGSFEEFGRLCALGNDLKHLKKERKRYDTAVRFLTRNPEP